MQQTCVHCGQRFQISQNDLDFHAKISPIFNGNICSVQPPTHCARCRHRRRYAHRDERRLYHRKCNFTGKEILSIYSQDSPYIVYANEEWWSDKWDGITNGRAFDFSRPFFEQFHQLSLAVPKIQSTAFGNENCPYQNRCANCRNCYMSYDFSESEDSYYCEVGYKVNDSIDCGYSKEMLHCGYCIDCIACYSSFYLNACSNVHDSQFCFDCHGSSNLICCWNLVNKQYCIWNRQYQKEDFEQEKQKLHLGSAEARNKIEKDFLQQKKQHAIHRFATLINCENCTGDHLMESRNCEECFDVLRGEDLVRMISVDNNCKDSRDCNNAWNGELFYESMSTTGSHNLFCLNVWTSSDMLYSEFCDACAHCFGCSGLRHKQYCIFNMQFTQEEYEALLPKIIEHMQKTKEWGEFFPIDSAPICYNESKANELFPLEREEAIALGFHWKEEVKDDVPNVSKEVPATQLPDTIEDVSDDILTWAIECEASQKPFRVIAQELELYRRHGLPLSRLHPEERWKKRIELRNPRHLYERTCDNCGESMQSTYAPERKEIVYCEECYLKEVYKV